jgi:hypothetical protein
LQEGSCPVSGSDRLAHRVRKKHALEDLPKKKKNKNYIQALFGTIPKKWMGTEALAQFIMAKGMRRIRSLTLLQAWKIRARAPRQSPGTFRFCTVLH